MTREPLTDASVWAFMAEGCNAEEIGAYGGLSRAVAEAWMAHAALVFAGMGRAG